MGSVRVRAKRKSLSTLTPGFKPKHFSFLQPRYQDTVETKTDSFQGNKQQNSSEQANPTLPFLGHSFGRVSVLPIQAKLTIGQPGDKYEQEADRVAAQIVQQVNSPQPQQSGGIQRDTVNPEDDKSLQTKPLISTLQRETMPEEEEEEKKLQTKSLLQRQEIPEEEEELQMKPVGASIQRQEMPEEEEEELQAKPIAGMLRRESLAEEEEEEEEEKVQMKRSPTTIQREALPEEEEEELQTKSVVQRRAEGSGVASAGLEASIKGARGQGQPLGDKVRGRMERAFGSDFSGVRVHTDAQSDRLNKSIQARAFTTGQDVFFRQGEYQPTDRGGQELLAHELTHVVQQSENNSEIKMLQRDRDKKTATLSGKVTMLFNGEELVLLNDGKVVKRFAATSGRPTKVKAKHAALCKGNKDESYINNPRYLAIKDHGAIPEGTYHFSPPKIQDFTEVEQLELIDAAVRGKKTIKAGTPKTGVHTGDWGRGRVHLRRDKIQDGPKPCTDTSKRRAFFLHGGILRGSAGCIDIGSDFDDLSVMLKGNKTRIDLEVKYKETISTTLTKCELMFGEVMYDKVTPNPLTFIKCFTELTNNADPEAKKIYEGLRNKFLSRLTGVSGEKQEKKDTNKNQTGLNLKDLLDSFFGGD